MITLHQSFSVFKVKLMQRDATFDRLEDVQLTFSDSTKQYVSSVKQQIFTYMKILAFHDNIFWSGRYKKGSYMKSWMVKNKL